MDILQQQADFQTIFAISLKQPTAGLNVYVQVWVMCMEYKFECPVCYVELKMRREDFRQRKIENEIVITCCSGVFFFSNKALGVKVRKFIKEP